MFLNMVAFIAPDVSTFVDPPSVHSEEEEKGRRVGEGEYVQSKG